MINQLGSLFFCLVMASESNESEAAAIEELLESTRNACSEILAGEEGEKVSELLLSQASGKRYLVARQSKMPAAIDMLKNSVEWYVKERPHFLSPTEMRSQISHGHMYSRGFDRLGHPCVMLRVHTERDPHTNEQKLNFMIYSMLKAIAMMGPECDGKMVWLVSCTGYNLKHNGDVGFARSLNAVLANHFPERLFRVYLFDVPFMFRMMWKCISPFLDETTKQKFVFVSNGCERETMVQDFELGEIERIFGGESDYTFNAETYVEEDLQIWNTTMNPDRNRV